MFQHFVRDFAKAAAGIIAGLAGREVYTNYGGDLIWSTGAALGVLLIFWLAASLFQNVGLLRRLFLENAYYEGVWFQEVNNERPYSLSEIKFSGKTAFQSNWSYSGYAFAEDGQGGYKIAAQWDGDHLAYDERSNRWFFNGKARIGDALRKKANAQTGGFVASIDFSKAEAGAYFGAVTDEIPRGTGEANDGLDAWGIRLLRIPRKARRKFLKGRPLSSLSDDEQKALLDWCLDTFGNRNILQGK